MTQEPAGTFVDEVELSRKVAAGIPGAELQTLPCLGHLATLEDHASTAELINRWGTRRSR